MTNQGRVEPELRIELVSETSVVAAARQRILKKAARRQRSAKTETMWRLPAVLGGRTLLQERAVKPVTRVQYRRGLEKFKASCRENGAGTTSPRPLEAAMCD